MARPADLLSVEEARDRILRSVSPLPIETVSLQEAVGRVLGEPIRSRRPQPPFANSSMDGFAVQSADTSSAGRDSPVKLRVAESIGAGVWSESPVQSGTCARIMTGAPLPPGSDAVVPFEDVEDRGDLIAVTAPVAARACVRPAGQDFGQDRTLLDAGSVLHAPQIGLLAAVGLDSIGVRRRPDVAILSTGDELVQPGTELRPGQIYNSNSPMLAAAVQEAGALPAVLPTAQDNREEIADRVRAASSADLLLTSGGASVGDFDHVKDVIGSTGLMNFWRVRVRPGKPLIFGTIGDTPVIGLPGNPTSAMVTFEIFVRPAIRRMLGAAPFRPDVEAVLDEPIDNRGGRRTYTRVKLRWHDSAWHASPSGAQDSAMLLPLARANGLFVVPEDRESMEAGETGVVQVWELPASS